MFDEGSKERIARAICEACDENPDFRGDCRGNEFRWMDYLPVANAAIDAVLDEQANAGPKFPRQPNGESGWTIDYSLLCRLSDSTAEMDHDFRSCVEEVELVLLALERDPTWCAQTGMVVSPKPKNI